MEERRRWRVVREVFGSRELSNEDASSLSQPHHLDRRRGSGDTAGLSRRFERVPSKRSSTWSNRGADPSGGDRERSHHSKSRPWSVLRAGGQAGSTKADPRSEEHTSELQSLMRISYAVFCLTKKTY